MARNNYRAIGVLCAALAFTGLNPPSASAVDQAVGTAEMGCGLVVMQSGDLFLSKQPSRCVQGPWIRLANVFESSGRGSGRVIGITNANQHVLAANGDWFQLTIDYNSCGALSSSFVNNVFGLTGVQAPGEEFVTFGGSGGGEYAATNYGNMFAWNVCGWAYVGALGGAPVKATQSSWGQVKTHYR